MTAPKRGRYALFSETRKAIYQGAGIKISDAGNLCYVAEQQLVKPFAVPLWYVAKHFDVIYCTYICPLQYCDVLYKYNKYICRTRSKENWIWSLKTRCSPDFTCTGGGACSSLFGFSIFDQSLLKRATKSLFFFLKGMGFLHETWFSLVNYYTYNIIIIDSYSWMTFCPFFIFYFYLLVMQPLCTYICSNTTNYICSYRSNVCMYCTIQYNTIHM